MTALAAATRAAPEQTELTALAEEAAYQRDVLGKRVSVLELLERYPSCTPGLAAFLDMLPPARARPLPPRPLPPRRVAVKARVGESTSPLG